MPVVSHEKGIRDFTLAVTATVLAVLLLVAVVVVAVATFTVHRKDEPVVPRSLQPTLASDTAVLDDFDRPDAPSLGTPRSGPAWTIDTGWGIENHEARITTTTGNSAIALTTAPSADGTIEVTLPNIGSAAGLIFRFRDLANYWEFVAAPDFGTFVLSKRVDGIQTQVGNSDLTDTSDGKKLGVVLDGANITLLLDDVELKTFTDPTFKDERAVGLIGLADDELRGRFDDFLVARPVRPASTSASSAPN
jgi:hypothetical protein